MSKKNPTKPEPIKLNYESMSTDQLIAAFRHNCQPTSFNRVPESGAPLPTNRVTLGFHQTGSNAPRSYR